MHYRLLFFVLFISAQYVAQAGGPWLQTKGSGYFQLSFNTKQWSSRFYGDYANTERLDLYRSVNETFVGFYGEYGLAEDFTVIADVPYRMLSTSNQIVNDPVSIFPDTLSSGQLNGLGNPMLGVRFPIWSKNGFRVAGEILTWINLSSYSANTGLRTDYDASTIMPAISLGSGTKNGFWSVSSGLRIRNNQYGESVAGHFQYGRSFWKKGYLILDGSYVVTLFNGEHQDGASEQTASYVDNQGFVAYGLKWYQKVGKTFSFNIAAYSGFAVVNQGTQPGVIFAGIAYELNQ